MPQRSPLREIPLNHVANHELSPCTRSKLYATATAGKATHSIARDTGLARSTLRSTFKRVSNTQSYKSQPRTGRPKALSPRDSAHILRFARLNRQCTYSKLQKLVDPNPSHHTVWRLLKRNDIINWRSKKRPYLTEAHARLRLAFAHANLNTDWSQYLFSDECSIEYGKGKKQAWSFGYPAEKWDLNKITTYKKGKGVTVMVWGAIGGEHTRSKLIVMERDELSARNGFTGRS